MSTNTRSRVDKGVTTGGQFAKENKSEATGVTLGGSAPTRTRTPLVARTTRNHILTQLEVLDSDSAVEWARNVQMAYPNAASFTVEDIDSDTDLGAGFQYQDAGGNQIAIDEDDADDFAVECPARNDDTLRLDISESNGPITFDSMEERYEIALEASRVSVRSGNAELRPTNDTTVAAWTGEDGVQVVQVDHEGGPVRVNVNDGPVFEGDPETHEHLSVANMFRPDPAFRSNLSTPPDLPEGYDPEAVEVEFDSDGDAYVSIEVPDGKGSGKVAVWARDVAGDFETGSNVHDGGESVDWENPDDEEAVLEHLDVVATNLHYAKLQAMEKVTTNEEFLETAADLARRGR